MIPEEIKSQMTESQRFWLEKMWGLVGTPFTEPHVGIAPDGVARLFWRDVAFVVGKDGRCRVEHYEPYRPKDFKDRMIEAVERGWATESTSYDYVRESYADMGDQMRKEARER